MKNRIIYTLICLCSLTAALGQHNYSIRNKKAIKFYEKSWTEPTQSGKIDLLCKAIKTDEQFVEAYWSLADKYVRLDSISKAVNTLETAERKNTWMSEQTKMRLSRLYYKSGRYEEALNKIEEIESANYIGETNRISEISRLKDIYKYALILKNNPVDFNPKKLEGVNTIYSDYFPSITADGKTMSTTVLCPLDPKAKRTRYQEDLYVSHYKNGKWTYSKPLPAPINSLDNEGSQSFSSDGRYMFFVMCGCRDNIGSCDIYYSIKVGNGWSNPINIGVPVNSEFWESTPSMSASGDKIYFTSNRTEGQGGMDIWTADIFIDEYGYLHPYNAKPIGKPINTEKDDFAPFIHTDNKTLYFSSNGHKGLGEHDIYVSTMNENEEWSFPINLGYPINTHRDEYGFVVNGKGDKAYFATNPAEGIGKMDIYEIDLPKKLRPKEMLFSPGKVYNAKTNQPLQAKVEIFEGETNNKYFESTSDAEMGDFTVTLPADGKYSLSVEKKGYLYYTSPNITPGDSLLIGLYPIEQGSTFRLNNLFFAHDSDQILKTSYAEIERLTEFLKHNSRISIDIIGHTDNTGSEKYNKDLSERRAKSLVDALIHKGIKAERMHAIGMGSSKPVASNETEEGRKQNRRVEVVIK